MKGDILWQTKKRKGLDDYEKAFDRSSAGAVLRAPVRLRSG